MGVSRLRDRISGKSGPRGRVCYFEKFFQLVLTNRKFGAGRPLSRRQIIPLLKIFVKSFLQKKKKDLGLRSFSPCGLPFLVWLRPLLSLKARGGCLKPLDDSPNSARWDSNPRYPFARKSNERGSFDFLAKRNVLSS